MHDKPISSLPGFKSKGEEESKDADDSETLLSVCEFVPKQDRDGTQKPKCSTNLYVKNFPEKKDAKKEEGDAEEPASADFTD